MSLHRFPYLNPFPFSSSLCMKCDSRGTRWQIKKTYIFIFLALPWFVMGDDLWWFVMAIIVVMRHTSLNPGSKPAHSHIPAVFFFLFIYFFLAPGLHIISDFAKLTLSLCTITLSSEQLRSVQWMGHWYLGSCFSSLQTEIAHIM